MAEQVLAQSIRDLDAWQDRFEDFMTAIGRCFKRAEPRLHAQQYIQGLLSDLERKNGWQVAEAVGDTTPYGKQHLLGRAKWSADQMKPVIWERLQNTLGRERVTLIVDDTGFLKKGNLSVGVQRQYTGSVGKTANCQIGVFLSYWTCRGHSLWDRQLFIPRQWLDDENRRRKGKIPDHVVYQSKIEIGRVLLERALERDIEVEWVLADSLYGKASEFRRVFEKRDIQYVVGVPKSQHLFYGGCRQRLDQIAEDFEPDQWTRASAGMGTKGPREADWVLLAYQETDRGFCKYVLFRRFVDDEEHDISYFFVLARKGVGFEEIIEAEGRRWAVEEDFETAKGEAGLDEYEVRSWHGWYRHITLSMAACAFLTEIEANQEMLKKTLQSAKVKGQGSLSRFKESRGL